MSTQRRRRQPQQKNPRLRATGVGGRLRCCSAALTQSPSRRARHSPLGEAAPVELASRGVLCRGGAGGPGPVPSLAVGSWTGRGALFHLCVACVVTVLQTA